MNTFKGICIGGPLDGKARECAYDRFNAHNLLPVRLAPLYSPPADLAEHQPFTVITTEYRHERLIAGKAAWGMWIADDLTMEQAIERLFSAYGKGSRP